MIKNFRVPDPFKETSWNLDQALIWLARGDPTEVATASDAAKAASVEGQRFRGWCLYKDDGPVDKASIVRELKRLLVREHLNAHDCVLSGRVPPIKFDLARLEFRMPALDSVFVSRSGEQIEPRFDPDEMRRIPTSDLREVGDKLAVQDLDWTPSASLEPDAVPQGNGDWVALGAVVDFLGAHSVPAGVVKGASRALFELAERGEIHLRGTQTLGGNPCDAIPAKYFHTARTARGDLIEVDLDRVSDVVLTARMDPKAGHRPWYSVLVRRSDVVRWLLRETALGIEMTGDGAMWRDRPNENPDEPTICLFDVLFWLLEVDASVVAAREAAEAETGKPDKARAVAMDKAEVVLRSVIKGRRLLLYGYSGEWHSGLERQQVSSDTVRALAFTIRGQPDWDRHEHGPRAYGYGSFEYPKTNAEVRGWTGLHFEKADVRAVFGSDVVQDAIPTGLRRTGAPGRPTSMDLIEKEFHRRAGASALLASVTEEAKYLAEWLGDAHPSEKPTTPKTIKNRLAAKFRLAKAGARN